MEVCLECAGRLGGTRGVQLLTSSSHPFSAAFYRRHLKASRIILAA